MTSSFCSLCDYCINCDKIVAMKKYNDKISNFLSYISYKQYLFDVTKCCGYSEFIAIYKDYTLCELYKNISLHFEQPINNFIDIVLLFKLKISKILFELLIKLSL